MAVIIPCRLRLSGAKVPCRMSSGAVGFDLWGAKLTRRNGVYCFDTGVEMELPVGFAGLLVARSSVVCSGLEMMGSGVQVIDPDYRGTVKVLFRKSDSVQARGAASLLRKPTVAYYEGQRVAQLIIVPTIMLSLAIFLGFRGIELVTLMAIFATPCAVAGYAMAQQMGSDADLAGNCVVYTTGLSCFTIFGWVFVLKTLGMF